MRVSKRQLTLLGGDCAILAAAPILAVHMYFWATLGPDFRMLQLKIQPLFFALHIGVFVLVMYIFDQYNFQQDFLRGRAVLRTWASVATASVLLVFFSYLLGVPQLGRWIFLIYASCIFVGILAIRVLYSLLSATGMYDRRALIVGCGESGEAIARLIQSQPRGGIRVMGFLDTARERHGQEILGLPVFWQRGSLKEAVRQHQPQLLIVAMGGSGFRWLIPDLIWCAQNGVEIWDAPTAFERLEHRVPLQYVDEMWLLFAAVHWPRVHIRRLKRVLDSAVAAVGLLTAMPLLLAAAGAIRVESRGPVLLCQKRLGKGGRIIDVYKLRTMYECEPAPGEKGTQCADRRITRVGRVLRKLHIDEIPQLINVLKGELSMVGPRAELFQFVYEYIGNPLDEQCTWLAVPGGAPCPETEEVERLGPREDLPDPWRRIIPFIEQRFTVPQGVTGWAQIMHPFVSSSYEDMVTKLEYDLYYIKNMSLLLDLFILLKTIRIVFLGQGK